MPSNPESLLIALAKDGKIFSMRLTFTRRLPLHDLDVLNLKLEVCRKPCPHCQASTHVLSHGYSRGYQAHSNQQEVRRLRFFAPIVEGM